VLVLHPWWGLNAFVRGLCERLAADGFVAFAPDLYGGETTSDIAQATELSRSVDVEQAGSLVTGGLRRLLGHPATLGPTAATLGLSMGASWAIWLSAQEPEAVAAVVAFYGTESVPFEKTKARFLGHYGDFDEYEPIEDVRKLEGQIRA
jgi:carboxymethylenebutenolidase